MYIILENNIIQAYSDKITYLKQNTRNKLLVGTSKETADYVAVTIDETQLIYPLKSGYGKSVHTVIDVGTIQDGVTADGTWIWTEEGVSQSEELVTAKTQEEFTEILPILAMAELSAQNQELSERLAILEGK